jgi:group I intron endonuclease
VKIATIYCVTNTLNGKQYVGVTRKTSELRWKEHCWKALRNPTTEFHHSLAKNGPSIFEVSDIASVLYDGSAVEREVIQRIRPVYNMTNGGEFTQGRRVAPDVVEKIRMANLGKKRSDASRKKMSISALASFEINQKRRSQCSNNGKKAQTPENYEKRLVGIKKCAAEGRMFNNRTPEQQANFVAAGRAKSLSLIKQIECATLNTTFDSISEASLLTGLSISSIRFCALGYQKSSKGLFFNYV